MSATTAPSSWDAPGATIAHLRSPVHLFNPALKPVMAFMFEKLEVYQKAVDIADEIAAMTEREGPLDRPVVVRHYA
ncbi:MAG: hypothetical protein AAB341_04865 [Planctomycetota bacterium]